MLEPLSHRPAGQDVIFPVSNPWSERGNHISILRGSLAPDGAVIKLSGKDIRTFRGPAKVFNSERETFYGITNGEVRAGPRTSCGTIFVLSRHPVPHARQPLAHAMTAVEETAAAQRASPLQPGRLRVAVKRAELALAATAMLARLHQHTAPSAQLRPLSQRPVGPVRPYSAASHA